MKFEYPDQLPVSAAREAIANAVRSSQVVIISGQTGSGKTTQLPKILLELGRGSHGKQIVHTQPRRLAARTVAERLADEMGVRLGDEIGYQVRFTDESSPKTRLRVVTDGILLAQIQRDPKLTRYDTIIIDEAHERSLNIDFLLGYLTALLPLRRDLKLIITSATIDSAKFQKHFEDALRTEVPVIEVSGRTYPVTICYEPLGGTPALMRHVPGFADGTAGDILRMTDQMNAYPTRLGMYTNYKTLTPISDYAYVYEQNYGSSVTLAYNGKINRSRGCYVMDITGYMQQLWNSYMEAKADAGGEVANIDWDKVKNRSVYIGPEAYSLYTTSFGVLQGMPTQAGTAEPNNAPIRFSMAYNLIK